MCRLLKVYAIVDIIQRMLMSVIRDNYKIFMLIFRENCDDRTIYYNNKAMIDYNEL